MRVDLEAAANRIPEGLAVDPLSPFAGLAGAYSVQEPRIRKATGSVTPAPMPMSLDGVWERALDRSKAKTTSIDFTKPPQGAAWQTSFVPQNYGVEKDLEYYFGPVFYRRSIGRPSQGKYVDLVFDAADYICDVSINDQQVERHEGGFSPFRIDVTDVLEREDAADLMVRIQDPLEEGPVNVPLVAQRKRWIKGVLNYHDSRPGGLPATGTPGWSWEIGQSRPSGGIVGSVALVPTNEIRIDACFVTPLDDRGNLHIALLATNRDRVACRGDFRLTFISPSGQSVSLDVAGELQPGSNRIDLRGVIAEPELWWDDAFSHRGAPKLYELHVSASLEAVTSHTFQTRFGIRHLAFSDGKTFRYRMNGEPAFIKAVNYIPTQHWSGIGSDYYHRDFAMMKTAHVHSVGIHGHVQSPACYEAADEAGISVFQDFALQWSYASGVVENPGFVEKACRMAAEMVYLLWNHPSVVYFCAHNEPLWVLMRRFGGGENAEAGSGVPPELVDPDKLGPDYDAANEHLDSALYHVLEKLSNNRFAHIASGEGIDTHEYSGTIGGASVYEFGRYPSPFVSEYGSFFVNRSAIGRSEHWSDPWPPNEEQLAALCREGLIWAEPLEAVGNLSKFDSLADYVAAAEQKSAFVAKYQTELIRIRRDRPYTGYRWHMFNNHAFPCGAGLVDALGRATPVFEAFKDASRPQIIVPYIKTTVLDGPEVQIDLHVVNDTPESWTGACVWRIERAHSIQFSQPEPQPGFRSYGGHISGLYAYGAQPPFAGLEAGRTEYEIGSQSAGQIISLNFLGEPGVAYRCVVEWPTTSGWDSNTIEFFVSPENWTPPTGAVRLVSSDCSQ